MRNLALSLFFLWLLHAAGPAFAQFNQAEALALINTYIARHNAHDIEGVMDLYAQEATFTLSANRGTISGKAAIRDLEMFDVMANSYLAPFGLTATKEAQGWRIDLEGVLESSKVFSAAGLPIVIAEATNYAFIVNNNKIKSIVQPEIRKACTAVIIKAFSTLTATLKETRHPKAALVLNKTGRLNLTPMSIPIVTELLETIPMPQGALSAEQQRDCTRLR